MKSNSPIRLASKDLLLLYLLLQVTMFKRHDCQQRLTIGLGLFIDRSLMSYIEKNLRLSEAQRDQLLRSYVHQIESNLSSLRSWKVSKIYIRLIEIFYEVSSGQFSSIPTNQAGNVDRLLDDFCSYQSSLRNKLASKSANESSDSPIEWDTSLLLTSQDLYSEEEFLESNSLELSQSTMGISIPGGIQSVDFSCSIVEFGTQSPQSQPRATSSIGLSAWVATHELAHNLGIHHDGPPFNAECATGCYVMSPISLAHTLSASGGTASCHQWSPCSIESLNQLDLDKFELPQDGDTVIQIGEAELPPGRLLDAQMQCRLFNSEYNFSGRLGAEICHHGLECRSRDGSHRVHIGPALEGTVCDEALRLRCIEMECR